MNPTYCILKVSQKVNENDCKTSVICYLYYHTNYNIRLNYNSLNYVQQSELQQSELQQSELQQSELQQSELQ
jgi:hypothetical protein